MKTVSILNSPFLSDTGIKCLAAFYRLQKIRIEGKSEILYEMYVEIFLGHVSPTFSSPPHPNVLANVLNFMYMSQPFSSERRASSPLVLTESFVKSLTLEHRSHQVDSFSWKALHVELALLCESQLKLKPSDQNMTLRQKLLL